MISIPAKKARIFLKTYKLDANVYYSPYIRSYYCFTEKEKEKCIDKSKFINFNSLIYKDVTVDEEGRLHSFDDKAALVFSYKGRIVSVWAENGILTRGEKAAIVINKEAFFVLNKNGLKKEIITNPKYRGTYYGFNTYSYQRLFGLY